MALPDSPPELGAGQVEFTRMYWGWSKSVGWFLVAAAGSIPVAASTAPIANQEQRLSLSSSQARAVIDAAAQRIASDYVIPDARSAIAQELRLRAQRGAYDTADSAEFARRVTADLIELSNDKHLELIYDPILAAALQKQGKKGTPADQNEYWRSLALRTNHGLKAMRVLPENVRYLEIAMFQWIGEKTADAYDHAMSFLAPAAAVVIDLRGNGGGSATAERYLMSHFVEPDTPLMAFIMRGVEEPVSRAAADLRTRLIGKPLYVLVDSNSASAAEAFAYGVKARRLGQIVGETTKGAAHRNERFALPAGYVLSVSIGRPIHPVTGSNWERAGVSPDIPAESNDAVQIAHLAALEQLHAAASGDLKARYEKALQKACSELSSANPAAGSAH